MCREQGITLNVVLQFAWHKLLHSYTGDEQTIVGTTVSGRDVPVDGIESSVGLYINTLPLMVQWDNNRSVISVLQAIQKDIAALNSHSAVSLASLQSDGERLFHSLLVFENYPSPW
ncbi:condensation domain-containing protein [Xenorhabdus thailandensis]|uniref:condensation domain-containing protein n=1 Tax=Xenorhabdus thailandensis TaxID=3136255 RepID=UPI0030F402E9